MTSRKFFASLLLLTGAAAATAQAWPDNERDFKPVTLLAYAPNAATWAGIIREANIKAD